MGRRYAKLVGKTVQFTHSDNSVEQVTITGADWSIGLTIQAAETKRYILCTHGPKSPLSTTGVGVGIHHTTLAYVYDAVMSGRDLKYKELKTLMTKDSPIGNGPSAETCAFSQ